MKKVRTLETNERFDLVQHYAQVDLELYGDKYRFECIAFLLALDTGLRASDLLNLKITDITFNSDLRRYECRSDIKKTGVKIRFHIPYIKKDISEKDIRGWYISRCTKALGTQKNYVYRCLFRCFRKG